MGIAQKEVRCGIIVKGCAKMKSLNPFCFSIYISVIKTMSFCHVQCQNTGLWVKLNDRSR